MTAHSKLGASSAYRWMNCPGSVALAAKMPKRESSFAAEGTAAHALAEWCLNHGYAAERFLGWVIGEGVLTKPGKDEGKPDEKTAFTVDEDMADAVQTYLDAVRAEVRPTDKLMVERQFSLTTLHEQFFGTNDACVYKPDAKKLIVFDYKHGRGVPVEVERNKQLMYYGLGAAMADQGLGLLSVELVIVQPRCPHKDGPVRRWETTPLDLFDFAGDLVTAARATEAKGAPVVAGDHCKFCPAAPVCPALYKKTLEIAGAEFGANSEEPILREPTAMSADELARVLRSAGIVKNWLKEVEEFAHAEAKDGRLPTGFKMVSGRSTRHWRDEQEAAQFLAAYGLGPKDAFTEPKLKSPAQIEKVIGRKNKDDIADLIGSAPGGTLLVPESDPRPAINNSAETDFGGAA